MTSPSNAHPSSHYAGAKNWLLGHRKRLAVLVSGRGSNLQALYQSASAHGFAIDWLIVSNQKESYGLAWALEHGLSTQLLNHRDFDSREAFDKALADQLKAFEPDLVVLAGFMRVLSPAFFARFQGLMINIHPSLLPSYPGLQTHRRALQDGVAFHGATVHSVTPELDHGPIVAQAVVGVHAEDDEHVLSARVLEMEHRLLPMATWALLRGDLQLQKGRWLLTRSQSNLPQELQFSQCLVHPLLNANPI